MLKEFKEFIAKGNVVEMAVGLIMATYFGTIVKTMVDGIVMPIITLITDGKDFSEWKYVMREAVAESKEGAGDAVAEVAIKYGDLIGAIFTFLIVAFFVFLVVKAYNRMKEKMEKKKEEEPAAPPAPSKEEVLLGEIRDLLKK